ncbi:MAG: transglycosylase domain-containing protein, partial [Ignavibacteriales bacterium]|nr:transglycosylase domain-containing protein [Ignavibacteriales bacterium]
MESVHSLQVTDRNGILLREFLNDQHGRGQWRPLSSISPFLQHATIAVEDQRFRFHPGVDPPAVLRALWHNIKTGSLRAGGSGITQQVIRNVYHHPRTLPYKVLEAWYAFRLERMMSKDEILEQYVNRAPYGNQLFGVEAASRYYFQKPALNLSLAEAAFLVALPNAPSLLNPYQNFSGVLKRQRYVLQKVFQRGYASEEEYTRALLQPVRIVPPDINFRAPHAVEMAVTKVQPDPAVSTIQTTIDYPLQQKLQLVVRNQLKQLAKKNVSNAAVVVIENSTGAIRALVGSADYFDYEHQGQVNGALALR